jgi:hypothetical protein
MRPLDLLSVLLKLSNLDNSNRNLSKLYLDHTLITDEGLSYLKNAKEIRYLNLVGTSVTEKGIQSLQFLKFRDTLYDVFIYNLDIADCIWYILSSLVKQKKISNADFPKVLIKTYCFFQYYNNNYRPIYHFENYLYNLTKLIHHF